MTMTAIRTRFRAGDRVRYEPSGEEMVLSCDEEHGNVINAEWPEKVAQASKCELVAAASDERRRSMLEDWASGGSNDLRGRRARRQLAALVDAMRLEATTADDSST